MYKFYLPIGDWSDDGHGKCEKVLLDSNKTVEEIREIYFDTCKKVGYGLDGNIKDAPCSEYDDNYFSNKQFIKLGLDPLNYKSICIDSFATIFIDFIKIHNPDVELNKIDDNIPTITFYGFDEQKRHIGYFGYGLFPH